jgi:hypothetical protein
MTKPNDSTTSAKFLKVHKETLTDLASTAAVQVERLLLDGQMVELTGFASTATPS